MLCSVHTLRWWRFFYSVDEICPCILLSRVLTSFGDGIFLIERNCINTNRWCTLLRYADVIRSFRVLPIKFIRQNLCLINDEASATVGLKMSYVRVMQAIWLMLHILILLWSFDSHLTIPSNPRSGKKLDNTNKIVVKMQYVKLHRLVLPMLHPHELTNNYQWLFSILEMIRLLMNLILLLMASLSLITTKGAEASENSLPECKKPGGNIKKTLDEIHMLKNGTPPSMHGNQNQQVLQFCYTLINHKSSDRGTQAPQLGLLIAHFDYHYYRKLALPNKTLGHLQSINEHILFLWKFSSSNRIQGLQTQTRRPLNTASCRLVTEAGS